MRLIAPVLSVCAVAVVTAQGRSAVEKRVTPPTETRQIAGLKVAVWKPRIGSAAKLPLLVFSHGFHGCGTQSTFLMHAFADAGYLVVAPDHGDASCGGAGGALGRPEQTFGNVSAWSDKTHADRRDDLRRLIETLHSDVLASAIDWTRVGLVGHSLGGYTVLGLAGAWPSWKMSNVRAVLALSPVCQRYVQHGTLGAISIPVMYQGGTADLGITPFVKRAGGCFDKNASPATFIEFKGAGHFAWTDLSTVDHASIATHALAFLDKYVGGRPAANPAARDADVVDVRVK